MSWTLPLHNMDTVANMRLVRYGNSSEAVHQDVEWTNLMSIESPDAPPQLYLNNVATHLSLCTRENDYLGTTGEWTS
jgi:hypothetical protein